MSVFGWSLPAGCGKLPGEEDDGPIQPRCTCGAFLPQTPTQTEEWESKTHCDGKIIGMSPMFPTLCGSEKHHEPHEFVEDAGTTSIWICKRCGKEHREG